MNSSVQCLRRVSEFKDTIQKYRAKIGDNIMSECTGSLGNLFNKLENAGDKVIPVDFFTKLIDYYPMFGEMTEKGDAYK